MNAEQTRAIIGLVLVLVGVLVMLALMLRVTVGGSAIGRVPPELTGLSPQDLAGLRRRVEDPDAKIPTRELPKVRATAEGMVARRIGVWFCLGGAIAGSGVLVTDPGDPVRVFFFVAVLALTGFTGWTALTRARAGAAFLERHPR